MLSRLQNRLFEKPTGFEIPFIGFCIALNLTVGQVTAGLKIPLYLDSLGTILAAILVGPLSAILTGSAANILAAAFGNPTMMFFIPVVVVIGLFTALIARLGWFRQLPLVVVGGILQGILAAVVSAPISAYLFSGITLGGTDFLVLYFRSVGHTLLESVFYQGLSSDPADKTISYLIVFFLVRNFPASLLRRFRGSVHILPPQKIPTDA
jgi:energy-coupling factor transport system substrate-specific component